MTREQITNRFGTPYPLPTKMVIPIDCSGIPLRKIVKFIEECRNILLEDNTQN
jgi:hypothetical protein